MPASKTSVTSSSRKSVTPASSKVSSSKCSSKGAKTNSSAAVKFQPPPTAATTAAVDPAVVNPNAPDMASPPPPRTQSEMKKGLQELETQIDSMGQGSHEEEVAMPTGGQDGAKKVVTIKKEVTELASKKSTGAVAAPKPTTLNGKPLHHTYLHQGNFPGGMTQSKTDVLKASLGNNMAAHVTSKNFPMEKAKGTDTLDAFEYEDEDDYESTVSSNPSVWEGNTAKKMQDMQWQFSCDPLRVSDAKGKHWTRLHSTNKQMIPQPGGGILLLETKIPYSKDEELAEAVASSGVAKKKKERTLPPLPLPPPVNTPLMKERLKDQTVPPLPQKPKVDLLDLIRNGSKNNAVEEDQGSSVFSHSTVSAGSIALSLGRNSSVSNASRKSNGNKKNKTPSQQVPDAAAIAAINGSAELAKAASVASSKASSCKTHSRVSSMTASSRAANSSVAMGHNDAASSVMSRGSNAPSSAHYSASNATSSKSRSSKVSRASTTASRLAALESKLANERAEVLSCASEVRRAQEELEAMEALLALKKK